MRLPLVSISIPTYNSEAFLSRCLDSVFGQTYQNIEVNIVDGGSKDKTKSIAKKYNTRLIDDRLGLLNARKIGSQRTSGEFILLLDSDQVLEPRAIERAVKLAADKKLDMLVLEEDVYKCETFLEKLFHLDRQLIHAVKDFSPASGVMLPRFYRRDVLLQAFENIPKSTLKTGGQDHAIIYYEALKISDKVDLLLQAVKHIEPSELRQMIPKFYRWGYTSINARNGKYSEMLAQKERFRRGMFSRKSLIIPSLASILLLLIKGVPFKVGTLVAKTKKIFQ